MSSLSFDVYDIIRNATKNKANECVSNPIKCGKDVWSFIKTVDSFFVSATTKNTKYNSGSLCSKESCAKFEINIEESHSSYGWVGLAAGAVVGGGLALALAPLVPLAGLWGFLGYTTLNTAGVVGGAAAGAAVGGASGLALSTLTHKDLSCTNSYEHLREGALDVHCTYGSLHLDFHVTFQTQ